ncbi:MAG: CPBP family intramembrane glutamic endopeptidase [Candidatus Thorarchaeota archaeon]
MLFLGIAFGWTWLFNALFISGVLQMPENVGTAGADISAMLSIIGVLLLMPFGPTIGGFVVAGLENGREGVRTLWKKFWSRRFTISWLIVILAFYPMYFLLMRTIGAFALGRTQPDLIWLGEPWILLAPFLASCLHGGLSEEFGWRGYALPILQARFDATTSSCILGVIEGAWHLPLAFIPGLAGWEGRALVLFFIWWIPVSITRTWVFNNTNGSVFAAVLFHAMGNTASDIVPINVIHLLPDGMGYFFLLLFWIPICIAIIITFGHRTLVRESTVSDYKSLDEEEPVPLISMT